MGRDYGSLLLNLVLGMMWHPNRTPPLGERGLDRRKVTLPLRFDSLRQRI